MLRSVLRWRSARGIPTPEGHGTTRRPHRRLCCCRGRQALLRAPGSLVGVLEEGEGEGQTEGRTRRDRHEDRQTRPQTQGWRTGLHAAGAVTGVIGSPSRPRPAGSGDRAGASLGRRARGETAAFGVRGVQGPGFVLAPCACSGTGAPPPWPPARKLGRQAAQGFACRARRAARGVFSLASDPAPRGGGRAIPAARRGPRTPCSHCAVRPGHGAWSGREGPHPPLHPGLGPTTDRGGSGRWSLRTERGPARCWRGKPGCATGRVGGHPGLPRPARGQGRRVGVARGSMLERYPEPGTPATGRPGGPSEPRQWCPRDPPSSAGGRWIRW